MTKAEALKYLEMEYSSAVDRAKKAGFQGNTRYMDVLKTCMSLVGKATKYRKEKKRWKRKYLELRRSIEIQCNRDCEHCLWTECPIEDKIIKDAIRKLKFDIQATSGKDKYSVGMRNGLKLALSLLDGKEPEFDSCEEEHQSENTMCSDFECAECKHCLPMDANMHDLRSGYYCDMMRCRFEPRS